MPIPAQLTMEFDLAFPNAGVGFQVQVQRNEGHDATALRVEVRALEPEKVARFTTESSRVLGDFVGGFCRWLGTKGVQVTHTEQEIQGHFHARYTVPQMLATMQELCEMLEDKFAGYPATVLG